MNLTSERALEYAGNFLNSAQRALSVGQPFVAGRFTEAADAMLHVAEHQQHLREGGGPKGPPPAEAVRDHLQRVYFRTQQADYFLKQSGARGDEASRGKREASFPKWARDFYQFALRAYDDGDMVAADENAKCADEVVRALESVAQAAAPMPEPPPPPKPPAPPGRVP